MTRARSTEPSAYEGDSRGAAAAAPRRTSAGDHLHGASSFLELLETHRRVEREALLAEAQRLGVTPADVAPDDDQEQTACDAVAAALAALRESGLAAHSDAEHDTYRLLVAVLVHDPEELQALCAATIAPLEHYDSVHDTELVVTLESFLAHHGSTTDTAEAMELHRHTVGYRLGRIQEVCGLSPYESQGRERLGLGLKAKRILAAAERRAARSQRGAGPAGPGAPGDAA